VSGIFVSQSALSNKTSVMRIVCSAMLKILGLSSLMADYYYDKV
jgi:hypothetical protein